MGQVHEYYHIAIKSINQRRETALSNPYSTAVVDSSGLVSRKETYQPKVFELDGRIGRLRYIAYTVGPGVLIWLAALALAFVDADLGTVLTLILYFPAIAVSLIMARRRLHDLGHSSWFCVLTFVPLLNLVCAIYLVCGRGAHGPNQYGPAPAANTAMVLLGAWLVPLALVTGMVSAIVIPAYEAYAAKSTAHAASQKF
jgi:uncharacterized membrane protein YhaH (DUF805 family)